MATRTTTTRKAATTRKTAATRKTANASAATKKKAPVRRGGGRKTDDAKAVGRIKESLASTKAVAQSKLTYTFRVYGRAPVIYSGQLLTMNDQVLEVRGHRSGSSKIDRHLIPRKNVISVLGGVGENSAVRVMEDNAQIASFTGRVKMDKEGYKIETAEGLVFLPFNEFYVKSVSEEPGPTKKR